MHPTVEHVDAVGSLLFVSVLAGVVVLVLLRRDGRIANRAGTRERRLSDVEQAIADLQATRRD